MGLCLYKNFTFLGTSADHEDSSCVCIHFFFGSSTIDEYYWGDIQETVDLIKYVMENTPEEYEFCYQSSW